MAGLYGDTIWVLSKKNNLSVPLKHFMLFLSFADIVLVSDKARNDILAF